MSQLLSLDETLLKANGSHWTAKEIKQQPEIWLEALATITASRSSIDAWLDPLLAKPNLRILLMGAGTSAFIGEALAPWLQQKLGRLVEAVSTTDLVASPSQYLLADVPTLLISFARSGDSPESVASIDLANQVLGDAYHLILTCNPQGYLAKSAKKNSKAMCIMMPAASNDRSFAMTSSFTSMLVSCATIFSPDAKQLKAASNLAESVIHDQVDVIKSMADKDYDRIVVLGAGCLFGIAREAALKCLELSGGKVVPLFDTPLGFRHGPKFVINGSTLVIQLYSNDGYTNLYDQDLFKELTLDKKCSELIVLSAEKLGKGAEQLDDIWLSLPYIVYCQMLAFFKALALDIQADNPCPSGEVNRVVAGVNIHTY